MTTYYKQKIETYTEIDKLIQTQGGIQPEDLYFAIERYKGFSKKFTLQYLNHLIERGEVIKEGNGKLYWRGLPRKTPTKQTDEETHKEALGFLTDLKKQTKEEGVKKEETQSEVR